jgi:hypothetical protein
MINEALNKNKLSGEWYHGDERKTDFINRNYFDTTDHSKDRNAMGPGIYFTNSKSQAIGYAGDNGYVYTCTVNLDPRRTLVDNSKIDIVRLRRFIEKCPDRDLLLNYAEDARSAVEVAVQMNAESSTNMLDALMGAYNDLYHRDAVLFAKVMTEIGYDAFYHQVNPEYAPEAIHLIVYNPAIIRVVKEEKKGSIKEGLKHLQMYESFKSNIDLKSLQDEFLSKHPVDFEAYDDLNDCTTVSKNFIHYIKNTYPQIADNFELITGFPIIGPGEKKSKWGFCEFHQGVLSKKDNMVIDLTYGQFNINNPHRITTREKWEEEFDTKDVEYEVRNGNSFVKRSIKEGLKSKSNSLYRNTDFGWLKEFLKKKVITPYGNWLSSKKDRFISFSKDENSGSGGDTSEFGSIRIEFDANELYKQGAKDIEYTKEFFEENPNICLYVTAYSSEQEYNDSIEGREDSELSWESVIEDYSQEEEVIMKKLVMKPGLIKSVTVWDIHEMDKATLDEIKSVLSKYKIKFNIPWEK